MLLYQLLSEHEPSDGNRQGCQEARLQGVCRHEDKEEICTVLIGQLTICITTGV